MLAAPGLAEDQVDLSKSCVSINGIVKCGEDGGTEWIVQRGGSDSKWIVSRVR